MRGRTLAEVPEVQRADAGDSRHAELENREASAGPQHTRHFRARHLRALHVANPEGDRHRVGAAVAQPAAASRRRGPAQCAVSPAAARTFRRPSASIAPAKSTPTTRAAPVARSARLERDIGRSRADVDKVSRPVSSQRVDRPLPPALVDPGAEQVIEQVVARRDRIEHAGDAIRRFVGVPP